MTACQQQTNKDLYPCTSRGTHTCTIQWNLSNPTCTGRDNLCRNRQGVGLHSVKHVHIEKKIQKGMKINDGQDRETNYSCVGLDKFYCMYKQKYCTICCVHM